MATGPASTRASAPRAGALSQLLAVFAVLALVGALAWAHHARRPAPAPAESGAAAAPAPVVDWVDPAQARVLGAAPGWVDPRWLEHLQGVLADEPPFEVGELAPLERLAARLGALSFVARVERCQASEAGLELALTLREPVACVP